MACYTVVMVTLTDDAVNREARRKLGLAETGLLTEEAAGRVRIEAGIIRSYASIRKLEPTAVIRRDGNRLTVSVAR